MVKALIELMLGDLGKVLIAQYNVYHLPVNLIVILYGTVLMWAHLNLRRVVRQMEALILDLAKSSASPLDVPHLFDVFQQQWKEVRTGNKLFLPTSNDLWFSRMEPADLIEDLKLQPEFLCVVLSKAGYIASPGTLSKQTYRVWELYRHQLLIGMRAHHLEPDVQLKLRGKQTESQKTAYG